MRHEGLTDQALMLLEGAAGPGEIREQGHVWPQELDGAKRDWQQPERSPIIKMMIEQRRAQRRAES